MNAIAFTAKQKQMLTLPHKTWNIFTGAVRSGKSYGTMFLVPQRIGAHYSEPCLIVGKTLATVERNVLRPLRTIFGGYDVGDIKGRADGGRYVTLWGKEVDCVGANDERAISKIHGAEYGYAYCDEMTLYPENFFRMLQKCLQKILTMQQWSVHHRLKVTSLNLSSFRSLKQIRFWRLLLWKAI